MAHCPRCSMEMTEGSHFCPRCSTPLPASETRSTPAAAPRASSGRLAQGELFLGRYRVEDVLGRGGMGVVYRAFDTHLRRPVALKTLRLELADSPEQLQRLGRRLVNEARAEAGVQHPSIVLVHDAGEAEGLSYIVMELVEGLPLSELLNRSGPLERPRALSIGMQVARALGYAHQRQVLHRDIKPGNVMLCPGDVVKVTDFGLAKVLSESAAVTRDGALLGTPAYMSPEQLQGKGCEARTDLYALGVLLYECIGGRRPFEAESLPALYHQILEAPFRPLELPDADKAQAYNLFFERALAKEPEQRFADAAAFAEALERLVALEQGGVPEALTPPSESARSTAPLQRPSRPSSKRRRGVVLVAVVCALVATAVGGYALHTLDGSRSSTVPSQSRARSAVQPRRSVAVLGFKNLSGRSDAAWLSTALSEMLTSELGAGEKLRTVPGETVARTKLELELPEAESLAADTLSRLRTNLGADVVVLGSYFAAGQQGGGKLRLDVRLQDTAAGETVGSLTETGTEGELLPLVARTGESLREKLGIGPLSSAEASGLQASRPSNLEAARLYAEGLEKLRRFDAIAARELLEKAVGADPEHALAHSALAEAWSKLGYDLKAKEAGRRAFELAGNLPREERLTIEGRYRAAAGEWDKAVAIYRTLWGLFPDNLEHGLALVESQDAAGERPEALRTVEALRKLPAPAGADPRVDLAKAGVVSGWERVRASAARAAEKAAASGQALLVARARLEEAGACLWLGQMDRAEAATGEARTLSAALGYMAGVGVALTGFGGVALTQGQYAKAQRLYEEALAVAREVGDKSAEAASLLNLGVVAERRGDLARSARMQEEAIQVFRETGSRHIVGPMRNLGVALYAQGDLRRARDQTAQTLAKARQLGQRGVTYFCLWDMGRVLAASGELAAAEKLHEEAIQGFRELGNKLTLHWLLSSMGELRMIQGDLAGARKFLEEALTMARELGAATDAAMVRVFLIRLWLEEGRLAEAERAAQELAGELSRSGSVLLEARTRHLLAQCFLEQGRLAEAREAIDRATALKIQYTLERLSIAITAARVRAASGETSEALKSLEAVLAEAMERGLIRHALEARLALGEVDLQAGKAAAGRARLEALEAEAGAKGFVLIARQAAAAAGTAAAAGKGG